MSGETDVQRKFGSSVRFMKLKNYFPLQRGNRTQQERKASFL